MTEKRFPRVLKCSVKIYIMVQIILLIAALIGYFFFEMPAPHPQFFNIRTYILSLIFANMAEP